MSIEVQVIYEKGLTAQRNLPFNTWNFLSSEATEPQATVDPNQVESIYGLRPILRVELVAFPSRNFRKVVTWLFRNCPEKDFLDMHCTNLIQPHMFELPYFGYIRNLQYVIGSVIYHCKRLAEAYREICLDYSKLFPSQDSVANSSNESAAYYEFEALVTAVLRAYESTRYILWNVFGEGRGTAPDSFGKTLKKLKEPLPQARKVEIPKTPLVNRLELSWAQFGEKAKEYRDCIQHKTPIDFYTSIAMMEKIQGGTWTTSLPIPDNPEVKSKAKFQYAEKIDALTYGWTLANEIMDLATTILSTIPQETKSQIGKATIAVE